MFVVMTRGRRAASGTTFAATADEVWVWLVCMCVCFGWGKNFDDDVFDGVWDVWLVVEGVR